jgi:molybdopterin-containing oxidoreductase family iron-sulfur binding subunit
MKTHDLKAGASGAVESDAAPKNFALPVISDKKASSMDRPVWRSIEEKNGDPSLLEARKDEFPKGAGVLDNVGRRGFLQLLGGGLAVAGASACWRPPEEKIFPFTTAPADVTPGVPRHYASALTLDGYATGVVVESYDGRPIKVEGNALHPSSHGATSLIQQA